MTNRLSYKSDSSFLNFLIHSFLTRFGVRLSIISELQINFLKTVRENPKIDNSFDYNPIIR